MLDELEMLTESIFDDEKRATIAYYLCEKIDNSLEPQKEEMVKQLENNLLELTSRGGIDVFTEIWIYSFLCHLCMKKEYIKRIIDRTVDSEGMSWQNKYFVFQQIHSILFLNPSLAGEETLLLNWGLLDEVFRIFTKDFSLPEKAFDKEDRNEDLVIVITDQFLSEQHGPTKTVLDRCSILKNQLHKNVLLINSAESMPKTGLIPFFRTALGNYNDSLLEKEAVTWKGESFSYYQCENKMPAFDEIRMLLNTVLNLKPGAVILVGDASFLAAVINKYVPVFAVGLTQSGIVPTLVDYQAVENRLLGECKEIAKKAGRGEDFLIPGKFTFALKAQTQIHTRSDLGLSEDDFVIAVIGARLDKEITEEFVAMLENVVFDQMKILLLGGFSRMDHFEKNHSRITKQMINLGMCEDVLSILDLCDIYVNPKRKGGATSAVEAMFKGKPVVTIGFGDVGGVVDDEFSYDSYDDMGNAILKLYKDKEYYNEQSAHAYELAEVNMDSATEFKKMFNMYKERMNCSEQ